MRDGEVDLDRVQDILKENLDLKKSLAAKEDKIKQLMARLARVEDAAKRAVQRLFNEKV